MSDTQIILYDGDGGIKIQVLLENESVWLTLNQIVELFGRDKSTISKHIKNIFESGELDESSTVAKNATVQNEGGRAVEREIDHYNLDVIISVGYRVNSLRGIQFRIWATQRLKEYLIKGFTMDDEKKIPYTSHVKLIMKAEETLVLSRSWRRGRDSNPRGG